MDKAFHYYSQYPGSAVHSVDGGKTTTLCGRDITARGASKTGWWVSRSKGDYGAMCRRCYSLEANVAFKEREKRESEDYYRHAMGDRDAAAVRAFTNANRRGA